MESNKPDFKSIDDYIATFPDDVQAILQQLRATIKAAAPKAKEKISYQMPAFAQEGNLVYFAAWKNHIGFYPGSSVALEPFKEELAVYDVTKGSIHFPLDKPLPVELISKIVERRVEENLEKARLKAERKKK